MISSSYRQECLCGRSFDNTGAFTRHKKACLKGKKRLASVLTQAKESYHRKKCRVLESNEESPSSSQALSSKDVSHTTDLEAQNTLGPSDTPPNIVDEMQPTHIKIPNETARSSGLEEPSGTAQAEDDILPLSLRRTRRTNRRLPKRFRDILPEPPLPLPPQDVGALQVDAPHANSSSCPSASAAFVLPSNQSFAQAESTTQSARIHSNRYAVLTTQKNSFSLFRVYNEGSMPSASDPEDQSGTDPPPDTRRVEAPMSRTLPNSLNPFHPYPNESSWHLGDWYWNQGAQKSKQCFKNLVETITSAHFCAEDLCHANWAAIDCQLGSLKPAHEPSGTTSTVEEWQPEDSGWVQRAITISVPFPRRALHPGPRNYTISNFYRRPLLSIIREALSDPTRCRSFRFEPYSLRWQRSGADNDIAVYGELFSSQAFITAHRDLQDVQLDSAGCTLPRRIVALMFWSDATQLTTFGDAKLWPLYIHFGNESKYRRCTPAANLCSHAAYFQTLPDGFKDFVMEHAGGDKLPGSILFTHCHRELFHAQWKDLLDDEFLQAYEHGMVFACGDNVERRLFPRIFTYSADYPEKVLIANIRNLGGCPCPRCTIPKVRFQDVATENDMSQRTVLARRDTAERREKIFSARRLIYEEQYVVDTPQVEALLKPESLVPTENAFSERLGQTGFDFFLMLVVDLLHEFELGVWKSIFIHLLRIVSSLKGTVLAELDRRFRQVPTFGRDTIRRFRKNVSELKKMAARDFEDVLQCSIPVFAGLLPNRHDTQVLHLLFVLCHWHGLAKLRLHTDLTLNIFERVTMDLGNLIRMFASDTCSCFATRELLREAEARRRREQQDTGGSSRSQGITSHTGHGQRPKGLNLQTYKLHALADYPSQIRMYGTTDSYSTQSGELEHRTSKVRFIRTSRKAYVSQLASIERRQTRIRLIRLKRDALRLADPVPNKPEKHHVIGQSQNFPEDLARFMQANTGDPAVEHFVLKLRAHILPRIAAIHHEMNPQATRDSTVGDILGGQDDSALEDHLSQLKHVLFKGDRIYRHRLLRINYTTYDLQREFDSINPRTDNRDIMLLSNPDSGDHHPFSYARVLGIFHANIIYTGPGSKDFQSRRVEFLWVRWFEVLQDCSSMWERDVLDTVRFLPIADQDTFGFVDPANVLRGCHIIPSFADGRLHPDGVAMSRCAGDSDDWNQYYVNRFVDRDMLMRYHWGLGIGHTYSHNSSTDSQFRTSHCSQPPHHVAQDNMHEGNEDESLVDGMQTELDLELEVEPEDSDSESETQSESESVLGDHVDMYGSDLDEMSGYEF